MSEGQADVVLSKDCRGPAIFVQGATAADVASFSIVRILLYRCLVSQSQGSPMFFEAITACEKAGRSREASQLMEDMASAGLPLDAIAFSACISACTQAVRGDSQSLPSDNVRSIMIYLWPAKARNPTIGPEHSTS